MNGENKKLAMEDLGYDAFFESNRKKLELDGFSVARVISQQKGTYKVKNTEGEYLAKITGRQMFHAASKEDYPAVGDWVAISETDEDQAMIRGILPRKTIIKRRHGDKNRKGEKNDAQVIAANIDTAFIVESLGRDYNLNRFERYFAIVRNSGVKPAMILNKIDLISREELDSKVEEIKNRFPDADVIQTSAVTNEGLSNLEKYIEKDKTYCFLGSSGVGKSSLINKLLSKEAIKTENISSYSDRGKHATTSREMYFLESGGIIIDNPGVREVGMADASAGIDDIFQEIIALAENCKYANCTHIHEPGCAVLAELKTGNLDESKYSNFISLKKEVEHYEMSKMEKKEKGKQFGKFIKKVKKDLKNAGHKDF